MSTHYNTIPIDRSVKTIVTVRKTGAKIVYPSQIAAAIATRVSTTTIVRNQHPIYIFERK